jgi:hypothetical protein
MGQKVGERIEARNNSLLPLFLLPKQTPFLRQHCRPSFMNSRNRTSRSERDVRWTAWGTGKVMAYSAHCCAQGTGARALCRRRVHESCKNKSGKPCGCSVRARPLPRQLFRTSQETRVNAGAVSRSILPAKPPAKNVTSSIPQGYTVLDRNSNLL